MSNEDSNENNSLPPVNINVGILGHVDSGKTSLAKALSRIASTAAFDKNPQSQERGITLDLGFSAFFIDVPRSDPSLKENSEESSVNALCRKSFGLPESEEKSLSLQFTLVDCPGHASLIRAVMGAAHIIDLMILVIDITKGIQTQTAECIVLGEMLGRKLVVVLNKIDLVPGETEEEKRATIEKKKKALRNVFSRTRWPNAPFVEVSANPGFVSSKTLTATAAANSAPALPPIGIDNLKTTLKLCAGRMAESDSLMSLNKKKLDPTQFFMMVDHCFGVKGHGTVLTGTVVGGTVSIGDDVKIPDLGLSRRVKSIQVFRKPVQTAHCGDRIGLCVTQVNAERLERGIACSAAPNSPVLTIHHACICSISKVRFFKGEIESSSMIFHVTIGHVTAMATMRFFSLTKSRKEMKQKQLEMKQQQEKKAASAASATSTKAKTSSSHHQSSSSLFNFNLEYEYEDKITEAAVQQFADVSDEERGAKNPEDAVGFVDSERDYYAVVLLDRPVTAVVGSKVIASHLDSSEKTSCRLAMHGELLSGEVAENLPASFGTFEKDDKEAWRALKVVKYRERQINIDKVVDSRTCVARPPKSAAQIQKEQEEREKKRLKKEKLEKKKAEKAEQKAAAAAAAGENPSEEKKDDEEKEKPAPPAPPVKTEATTTTTTAITPSPNAAVIPVVFHQPVVELTKFIGFPVIFRRRVKRSRNNTDNKNIKKNTTNNDDDDDTNQQPEQQQKQEENTQIQNNNNEEQDQEKQQQLPRYVDIRGKIDSVIGGSGGKVKLVFDDEAFEGNRAFGNVLLLDKKYPFSTSFKVEADADQW